ncbi:MAG: response regulator [Lacunisphaera sp.]
MALSSVIDADPEQARLAALHSYRLIDTPPESKFDAIAKRAADLCEATAATLVLVDERRCWFKARVGIEQTEIARDLSFCNYALRSSGVFVVPDATKDPRFSHLPVVNQHGVQFFAGVPLVTPYGFSIGTLCVLDSHARDLSAAQSAALKMLSSEVMDLFEEHRAKAQSSSASTPPISLVMPNGKTGSLLIVDDDDAVRSFVCVATRRLGYHVIEATNGVDALQKLEQNPGKIGLVLTDINMPMMDGVELVKALKVHPEKPPIAVMSGRFDPYIRNALQSEGVTALLSKPFSTGALKQTLLKAIQSKA